MFDEPKHIQLVDTCLCLLEEAILDVLSEAKQNNECMGAKDIARRAGIPTEKVEGAFENAITAYILGILHKKGKVQRCQKQPGGNVLGWQLTNEGFKSMEESSTPRLIKPIFELKKRNINAVAQYDDNGKFFVLKNSEFKRNWTNKTKTYKPLHHSIISNEQDFTPIGMDKVALEVDLPFKSPSAASSVVLGRSTSGYDQWKVKGTNITLGEWLKENKKTF